jgi:hypothetical protein
MSDRIRARYAAHYGFGPDCEDCERWVMLGNKPMVKNRLLARHRVLVEVDFLSNPQFAAYLAVPGFLCQIADGLASGVTGFAGYLWVRDALASHVLDPAG